MWKSAAIVLILLVIANHPPLLQADERTRLSIVPAPAALTLGDGRFELTDSAAVYVAPELRGSLTSLRMLLSPATGLAFTQADSQQTATIGIFHDASIAEEGYRLRVEPSGVSVHAATNAGAFYALQTLRQLLPPKIYNTEKVAGPWVLPAIAVEDKPRFGWRGLHLDVGRHFMPLPFIKKYIDLLAVHKMNRFHWHLTEDQGWRIEIMQYPRLTEIGSQRAQTVEGSIMFTDPEGWTYDGIPHGGFYTQEEVREVVAYAAARHITVVPEIEFPGHAQAAIASYPWLGNTGEQLKVKEEWGINKNTIKPSEETLEFYRNVLSEVMDLFPSKYIHIGGDEAPKDQWEASEFAQQRIRELGLADENELQSWLIQQMDDFLTANGRTLVGWDEIMQGGLSSNATVMSWRGTKPGYKAAAAGHDVVMAPVQSTYLDYYQASPKTEPLAIGSYLPLRTVYAFDPAPASLPEKVRRHILGAQGQLWTEYMKTPDHVEYMAYPRAVALSEVVWSEQSQRDFNEFLPRLNEHLQRLDVLQVNYRAPGNDELGMWESLKHKVFSVLMRLYFWYADL